MSEPRRAFVPPVRVGLPEGWSLATLAVVAPRVADTALMFANKTPSYRPNLVVQLEPSYGRTPAQLAATSAEVHRRETRDFHVVASEDVEVAGRRGVLREQTLVEPGGSHVQQFELFLTVDEERAVHALAGAPLGQHFEGLRATLRQVLLGLDITQ